MSAIAARVGDDSQGGEQRCILVVQPRHARQGNMYYKFAVPDGTQVMQRGRQDAPGAGWQHARIELGEKANTPTLHGILPDPRL